MGPAGVNPTKEGLDQPVDHLLAHPLRHERPDRHIALRQVGRRQVDLASSSRESRLREHPARLKIDQILRHPHHAARQGTQRSSRQELWLGQGRVHHCEAQLV